MSKSMCPCGSGKEYADCCEPFIIGKLNAPDAEKLMRSRYTAYTLNDEAYLLKTWHRTTKPAEIDQFPCKWIGLNVLAFKQDGQTAIVEFVAKYKVQGRAEKMHEISQFVFEEGLWLYLAKLN